MHKYSQVPNLGTYSLDNFVYQRGHDDSLPFSADLMQGAVKIAEIWDDGWGGCIQTRFRFKTAEKELLDFIKQLPSYEMNDLPPDPKGNPLVFKYDLDAFLGELSDYYQLMVELRKRTKKGQVTLYSRPDDEVGSFWPLKMPYSDVVKEKLLAKYGQDTIIWNERLKTFRAKNPKGKPQF